MTRAGIFVGVLATLGCGSAAIADSWTEVGDAGETASTAQITSGVGDLKVICADLSNGKDVDIFCIYVPNPSVFDATSAAPFDAQIFLFSLTGIALSFGDQNAGSGQGRVTGQFLPGPGHYLVALTRYNNDPLNGAGQLIWDNTPRNQERAPDGPGAPGPLASWNDNSNGANGGGYKIDLKGAEFCIPAPAAGPALLVGVALLGRRRR